MIKFLITKGGDTTVNVGIPNKPYINGFRTILDKTEGFVYFAFLGYYDEAMQGNFDGAYMYPVLVLRMQCENGGVPPENSVIQYAFGQYNVVFEEQTIFGINGIEYTIPVCIKTIGNYPYANSQGIYMIETVDALNQIETAWNAFKDNLDNTDFSQVNSFVSNYYIKISNNIE